MGKGGRRTPEHNRRHHLPAHRNGGKQSRAPLSAVVLAAGLAAGPLGCSQGMSEPDVAASVFAVEVSACGTGVLHRATGVAVAPDLVVTVAHTFERAATVQLVERSGATLSPVVVWLDPERDIAVLRLAETRDTWLPLGDADDDEPIEVVSMARERRPTAEAGRILRHASATLDGQGRRAALEVEATVRSGDSGSPVVTEGGEVTGIVFAAVRETRGPEGRAWAVASSEIAAALGAAGSDPVPLAC